MAMLKVLGTGGSDGMGIIMHVYRGGDRYHSIQQIHYDGLVAVWYSSIDTNTFAVVTISLLDCHPKVFVNVPINMKPTAIKLSTV